MNHRHRSGGLKRGLLHPAAIVLALITLAASWAAPLWAIPTGLSWALTVLFLSLRPVYGRGVPRDLRSLPPSIQRHVFQLRQALAELRAGAAAAPAERQILLGDVLAEAEHLEQAVLVQALAAGGLHDYLAATADQPLSPEREQMLALLRRYRASMTELTTAAQGLANTVHLLAAGQLVDYDAEHAPARQMDELKAGLKALQQVMSTSSMLR